MEAHLNGAGDGSRNESLSEADHRAPSGRG